MELTEVQNFATDYLIPLLQKPANANMIFINISKLLFLIYFSLILFRPYSKSSHNCIELWCTVNLLV